MYTSCVDRLVLNLGRHTFASRASFSRWCCSSPVHVRFRESVLSQRITVSHSPAVLPPSQLALGTTTSAKQFSSVCLTQTEYKQKTDYAKNDRILLCTQAADRREDDPVRATRRGRRIPLRDQTTNAIQQILEDHEDTIREFADLLQCPVELVQQMVQRDTRLVTHFPKQEVAAKMKLLLKHGFQGEEITARYQLFSRSSDFLQSRLKAMELVKPYRHHLSLLLLSNVEFDHRIQSYMKEVAVMGDHPSQTSFVARLLDCTETDIASLVASGCRHLVTMLPSRLQEIVQILKLHGISPEDMRRNCRVLKCAPEVARTRLQAVKEAGLYDTRRLERILLSSESRFQSSLERWWQSAEALKGLADKREMLKQRLGCSDDDIDAMFTQAPAARPLTAARLADSLDVLLGVIGISPTSVVQHPALLFFSTVRLKSRWAILQHWNLLEHELIRALILPERKFRVKFVTEDDD